MKRGNHGRYSKAFREEAVKMVTNDGLSAYEASRRLSLPKSTLENWVRAFRTGKLKDIGKHQRPLTEVEQELARVKRELSQVKQERNILKKAAVDSIGQQHPVIMVEKKEVANHGKKRQTRDVYCSKRRSMAALEKW